MTLPGPSLLDGFELSPQQARLWHGQHGADATPATLTLACDPPCDADRLRHSLHALIGLHEILRTRYHRLPGMAVPVQVIADPDASLDSLGLKLMVSEDRRRATLQLPALHADAASLHELAQAWAHAYLGRPLDDAPLQYADYAAWRVECADEQGRKYWEARLAALGAPLPLPLCRHASAPPVLSASISQAVPADAATWHRAAALLGCAPAIVALAAWLTLWHRHSEADRLTIAIDDQHRSGPLATAIGQFAEPLPLTMDGLGDLTFSALCDRLVAGWATLEEWRDSYPSERHTLPDAPVLQLGFRDLPQQPDSALPEAGWRIEHAEAIGHPLPLLLSHHPGQAQPLTLWADATLYDAPRLALLVDQLSTLLAHACREPHRPLAEMSATSDDELRRLTTELAASPPLSEAQQQRYDEIASLPDLVACFDRNATRVAHRPAVTGPSGSLSYGQLDERAHALAQRLLAQGLRNGTPVAHFLPRDVDAIVALLAILKAGGCYVPVDPNYPAERIAHILRDSQAEIVLTRHALHKHLPEAWRSRTICVEENAPTAAPQPWPAIAPHQPAYLIYTSGSTGLPKGVVITHANALHSLAARVAHYPHPVRRFLLLSSFAFDSSIAGLFWSLAQGGCLHLASEDEQKDPAALACLVRGHGVTHLLALPSLHALLLEQLGSAPTSLDTVIVAGEACPPALVEAHFRQQPHARLYNEYGPTEASVWSTVAECRAGRGDHPVPIGRAIAHSRVYLLDAQGAPVARGMKGELHIAGPGLSPGYLDRPELTSEKFVQARHPALRGERLYRTGDHACFDDEDQLVFLGRADAQVKLRGYRIELGEIEAVLSAVTSAPQVVVLLDATQGEPRLRAFVEAGAELDRAAIEAALARRLPAYMRPSDIQALPALPRTANGKADARALLTLAPSRTRPAYRSPNSPTEKVLAELWEELLGQREVGLDDDFFALGGHSLLVVKLVHRMRASLHVELQVSAVFQHSTLKQLAAHADRPDASSPRITLQSGAGGRPPLFCLHRPSGDAHHYLPWMAALPPDLPVHGLTLPPGHGPYDTSLPDLAQVHLATIRATQPAGPYLLCGWSMGGLLALEIARLLETQGEQVAMLSLIDTTFHDDDDPLAFDDLLARVRGELTLDSRDRLAAMPRAVLDELQRVTDASGKADQLAHALLTWPDQHGLELSAPMAQVEAELAAMRAARGWLRGYTPPRVASTLHLWWAEDTLIRHPALPTQWEAMGSPIVHHRVPGDHDSILVEPEFHRAFNGLLP